ncbi:TonB family C-terminal domain-containing protein [Roseivivax lentus]|uniref:TonB family C-terminal domain-containing protein n=1 Tax=Roseivivax lentus TaxID=633194 RepID=A0A1N7P026_9RHOB|nr:TonB family protein [Roseivivax lentus]SIT03898.1 TonB family C-terminal domain-containing protein [Roseivivax lentus]
MSLRVAAVFGGLALGLHLGAFAWLEATGRVGGGTAGGAGGAEDVTVMPQTGEIAALVARWTAPLARLEAIPGPVAPTATIGVAPQVPKAAPAPGTSPQPDRLQPPETAPEGAPAMPEQTLRPRTLAVPDGAPAAIAAPTGSGETAPLLPATPAAPSRIALPQTPATPDMARDPVPEAATETARRPTLPVNPQARAPRLSARPALRPDGLAHEPAPARAEQRAQPAPGAEPPTPPPAVQAGRTARGAGGTAAPAQTANPAPAPGPSAAALRDARAQWGAAIRQAVARAQRYPRGSRATGRATVRLNVAPSGRLLSVALVASAGDPQLDRAALEAARRAGLPRAPGVLQAASYAFDLPLSFARR